MFRRYAKQMMLCSKLRMKKNRITDFMENIEISIHGRWGTICVMTMFDFDIMCYLMGMPSDRTADVIPVQSATLTGLELNRCPR